MVDLGDARRDLPAFLAVAEELRERFHFQSRPEGRAGALFHVLDFPLPFLPVEVVGLALPTFLLQTQPRGSVIVAAQLRQLPEQFLLAVPALGAPTSGHAEEVGAHIQEDKG